MKKGGRTELEESTCRIKTWSLSLELYHVYTNIFVIIFVKTEKFELHTVSIFAACTGESHTPLLQVVEHNLERNNQYNDYNDENH